MSEPVGDPVRWLLDRAAISDLLFRYAASIDRRDWDRFATCFTADVEADYGDLGGAIGRDQLVRRVRRGLSGFDATHHISTNHEIDLAGDSARSWSYLHGVHYLAREDGTDHVTLRGHYTKDYLRAPDGWRIRRLKLDTTWRDGDMALFALARERWRAAAGE